MSEGRGRRWRRGRRHFERVRGWRKRERGRGGRETAEGYALEQWREYKNSDEKLVEEREESELGQRAADAIAIRSNPRPPIADRNGRSEMQGHRPAVHKITFVGLGDHRVQTLKALRLALYHLEASQVRCTCEGAIAKVLSNDRGAQGR